MRIEMGNTSLMLALPGETKVLEYWVLASSLIRVLVPPVSGALGVTGLSGRAFLKQISRKFSS